MMISRYQYYKKENNYSYIVCVRMCSVFGTLYISLEMNSRVIIDYEIENTRFFCTAKRKACRKARLALKSLTQGFVVYVYYCIRELFVVYVMYCNHLMIRKNTSL